MHAVVERTPGADPPDAETRLRRTLESFDEKLCGRVLEELVENGTYLVPTHGTREMDARAADPTYRNDPRWQYVGAALREKWEKDLGNTAAVAPALGELYLDFYELGLRLTGMAQEAGVRIMVGTDANDTMIFPGFGVHDELERFARAGIAPMEILRAATTVPAKYLGRSDDLGGIAAGKLADLVLLRADPLENIRNTRDIEAVIQGGRVFDRAALDRLLLSVEAQAAASDTHQ